MRAEYNCQIPLKARIGEGTRLGIGGTVIHPPSVIGRNCVIAQNLTLGVRTGGNGFLVIGNDVFIAPGAQCVGGESRGNVVVGADSVVLLRNPTTASSQEYQHASSAPTLTVLAATLTDKPDADLRRPTRPAPGRSSSAHG